MARGAKDLSVSELESILASRMAKLETLQRERMSLLKQLAKVDRVISKLGGRSIRGRKFGSLGRSRRAQNGKPLKGWIVDLLAKNKKGLTLEEISAKLLDSGYKTASEKFKNVIYQCLYHNNEFEHDKQSGKYVYTAKSTA